MELYGGIVLLVSLAGYCTGVIIGAVIVDLIDD